MDHTPSASDKQCAMRARSWSRLQQWDWPEYAAMFAREDAERRSDASELQGAEAEIRRLRAALKPFADLGVGTGPDDEPDAQPYRILRGAIRQARRALGAA